MLAIPVIPLVGGGEAGEDVGAAGIAMPGMSLIDCAIENSGAAPARTAIHTITGLIY
jgi:hypothetical protein